ncbi:major capsid protein [Pseudaminobacter sp. NGMCC 1.201702]|uniref:hypothetical protein n=1 Tax=Pseudaminobacter sp. NGMCC 1.201702 TaxID=3391825 RepID=UPI0039F0E885
MSKARSNTQPIATPRTMRRQAARGITSLPAGKMVPIAAFPLLREDAVRSGRLRFSFESMETAEILMNAINVRVMAYLVPNLALERFNGSMDQLNLSYEGKPPLEGELVVPYIETAAFGAHGANAVYKYLGLHGRPDQLVNTAYLEAYNRIWNFRAENRSPDLALRTRLQTDLAPAFWSHEQFRHIVPDFDQAVIDGEVPLNVVNSQLAVKGIAFANANPTLGPLNAARESDGSTVSYPSYYDNNTSNSVFFKAVPGGVGSFPEIFAEMEQNGITVSLSNIEMARKTQAFARLRQQYNAHDDWIINLLMDGISIPEQAFKQPMLLADKTTIFGMAKRYASDGANLTESVVNGATFLDMSVQVPRIGTGGIVMIVAEITPDQLFERQEDPYLHTTTVDMLPQYLRDTLDPEKVEVVKNGRIDVDHDTPDATFGYEPLNARWNIDAPRVGGRFYRPEVDAGFDEDRQRIWAVETANPTLSTDFYLCTNMHTKPFVVTNQDPFEVVTQGDVFIEGNTVFGGHLVEATDDYEKVLAVAPQDRIAKA